MTAVCGAPVGPLADFGSVSGGAGCGVAREVTAPVGPLGPIKRKCSAGGAGGCGVSRGVRAAGKPARPILAAFAAREGAGLPAGCETPPRPLKPIKKEQHHKRTTIIRYVVTNHNS